MKPDRQSLPLLQQLHERVFAAPEVRAVIEAGFARLAAELRSRLEPPHATCTIPIEVFARALPDAGVGRGDGSERKAYGHQGRADGRCGDTGQRLRADVDQVRLCRLFLLRRGARMAAPERHRNSVQRLVSYRGSGCIHQGRPSAGPHGLRPRAICSPPAVPGQDARPPGQDGRPSAGTRRHADLDRYWDIVPVDVWHFPEAAADDDWATVTFHSAAEEEIMDEMWPAAESEPDGASVATRWPGASPLHLDE